MLENLLKARRRYRAMLDALSGQNPVDLSLRRDLEAAITGIDAKLAAGTLADHPSAAGDLSTPDAALHIKTGA